MSNKRFKKYTSVDAYNKKLADAVSSGNKVLQNLQRYKELTYEGNTAEAAKYYKKVVKAVDQQLVRLEQLKHQGIMQQKAEEGNKKAQAWVKSHHVAKDAKLFVPITDYAYQTAIDSLQRLGLKNRFNVKVSESKQRSVIAIAERFLLSDSNTKSKVINLYKKKAEAFNDRYDTNFTWQELANFFNSAEYEKLKSMDISSDAIFKAIGKLKTAKDPGEMIESIKKGSSQIEFTDSPDDELAKRLIQEGVFDDFVKAIK